MSVCAYSRLYNMWNGLKYNYEIENVNTVNDLYGFWAKSGNVQSQNDMLTRALTTALGQT